MRGNISVLHDEKRAERFITAKVSPLDGERGSPRSDWGRPVRKMRMYGTTKKIG